ncbi:hypothetical protein ACQ86N_37510 [Puia sp. P3]|uniref:hypothetical protein n=1 Tax=Puia sp. P3 TaxID=3423952 RepID=UPI003D677742
MKACALLLLTLLTLTAWSQNTINNYKYVLVPERFDFSKEDNQYGLNTTAKLLLEQKGFTTFMGNDAMPPAVATNRCNALKAEVVQKKGLFVTNLTLLLKDCQGNIVFKSKEGKSREKEFLAAYDEALKNAFASLSDVPYKYDSTLTAQQTAAAPAVAAPVASAPAPAPAPATAPVAEITGTLYAQVTPNGYQLIDTTPKKVLTLLKTSAPDYYIAGAGGFNGVVFKKDGEWIFEYYKDDKLVSKKLEIKF